MEKEFDYGARLRHIRELRGLTQAEVANLIGTNIRNYQYYEYGKRRLPATTLHTILYALDISADYFFGFTSNPLSHKDLALPESQASGDAEDENVMEQIAKIRLDLLRALHDLDSITVPLKPDKEL